MADTLKKYRAKRNFSRSPEPGGESGKSGEKLSFVVQKHWASHLHYDFRLEFDGVLKSWAVPKGPTLDPAVKRMAIEVEDHPLAYRHFEGSIPKGEYGAGEVIVWDQGWWQALGDVRKGLREGHLKFDLHGQKLKGRWALVRMKGKERQPAWLLIKEKDDYTRSEADFSVADEMPDSVIASAPDSLPGKEGAQPYKLKPQLATLYEGKPPGDAGWIYELKFDGYRILARLEDGRASLYTRNGHDWSAKLPALVKSIESLPVASAWIDGEIVVLSKEGVPSFQALQNAFDENSTDDIVFYAFDVPYLTGRDLRDEPLRVRREWLEKVIHSVSDERVRFSEAFDQPATDLVSSACRMGLEGIIAKRESAPYLSGRSRDWVKLKCSRRQEFIVLGYTPPKGGRQGFGALLLAVREDGGGLRYAGRVGTGFNDALLKRLLAEMRKIERDSAPELANRPRVPGAHWLEPTLVCEVSFSEWTADGHIRHPAFRGMRTDKPAKSIKREVAVQETPAPISHPERVVDKSSGLTKMDVARYYGLVAPLMLEHLTGRPVALLRAPAGVDGQMFFQKHLSAAMPGVISLPKSLDPDHEPLMEIRDAQGLMSAVQMNAYEFHTWNAVKRGIGKPDRLVFDLDPGQGVEWAQVRQGAELLHALLDELGLESWPKTSGGKGLHVVVPLRKQYGWDTVKAFSQAVVQHLAQTLPKQFVAKSGPKNRVGKIFIDYLRNGFGATTVAAWSARARPGMGISVPLAWAELKDVKRSDQWTIANVHERLKTGNRPWDGYRAQGLAAAMKRLGFKP